MAVFDRTKREEDWLKPKFKDYIKLSLKTKVGGWPDIPVEIGPQYEGERIRASDMYCEFGGPKISFKGEIVVHKDPSEVEDEKVIVIGPEIDELQEGGSYPLGFSAELAGDLSEEMAGALLTRLHYWGNYIHGLMHLNSKDDIWIRINKDAVSRGFRLQHWGKVISRLFKAEISRVKKVQVKIITNPKEVEPFVLNIRRVFADKERKMAEMTEDETRPWYSCTLCQSFASTHVCIITPQRPSLCGAITWADARAGHELDPQGSWQPFDPEECLDSVRGEWTGANKTVKERSGGINTRFFLHSMFTAPHTSCGCFEAVAFYISEVDGIGLVWRKYTEPTANGLTFSTMAARTGGGQQIEGLLGISTGYMRSPKFFQADGGWERIVWMPSEMKETVLTAIPEGLRDKIATEKDAPNVTQMREFLETKQHPVVNRWAKAAVDPRQVLKYLEEHGGELILEEAAITLGTRVDQIMKAIEELKAQGIIE